MTPTVKRKLCSKMILLLASTDLAVKLLQYCLHANDYQDRFLLRRSPYAWSHALRPIVRRAELARVEVRVEKFSL